MESTQTNETKRKILVADDEESVRDLLNDFLGRTYEITTVEDGRIALDKIRQNQYDIFLTDNHMPKMSGCDAYVAMLRENNKLARRTIIMTGLEIDTRNELEEKIKSSGYTNDVMPTLIGKPFSLLELKSKIEEIIFQYNG